MAARDVGQLVAYVVALERRDADVAAALSRVVALAGRAADIRTRATTAREALAGLPDEHAEIGRRRRTAEEALAGARDELAAAEAAHAGLEGSRRRRVEELERAEKEVTTARQTVRDARAQLARVDTLERELREREKQLLDQEKSLLLEVDAVAGEIRALPSVAEATMREAGAGLAGVAEWGGQTRAALFVARSMLEQERERIVVEANALGSAVLGEQLGTSSAALVRRRLEAALG